VSRELEQHGEPEHFARDELQRISTSRRPAADACHAISCGLFKAARDFPLKPLHGNAVAD